MGEGMTEGFEIDEEDEIKQTLKIDEKIWK